MGPAGPVIYLLMLPKIYNYRSLFHDNTYLQCVCVCACVCACVRALICFSTLEVSAGDKVVNREFCQKRISLFQNTPTRPNGLAYPPIHLLIRSQGQSLLLGLEIFGALIRLGLRHIYISQEQGNNIQKHQPSLLTRGQLHM